MMRAQWEAEREESMRQDQIDRDLSAEKIGNRPDAWCDGDFDCEESCEMESARAAKSHWKPGAKVWYRGLFANSFSLRGVVECLKDADLGDLDYIGVRLENGNLRWADESRVVGRNS